mgnify:CR=1 FL=1
MKDLVHKFQCPGCVSGHSPDSCQAFALDPELTCCKSHVLGTAIAGVGAFALGLPRGFNRPGQIPWGEEHPSSYPAGSRLNTMFIRLWKTGTQPVRNNLNIPVWAMEGLEAQDSAGFLFVRTVLPRKGLVAVDVIEGGTLALVPNALDVSKFYDEID